jgi:hypothetical protein
VRTTCAEEASALGAGLAATLAAELTDGLQSAVIEAIDLVVLADALDGEPPAPELAARIEATCGRLRELELQLAELDPVL